MHPAADDHPPGHRGRPPEPEYGPRGYLPERAAKRARKIILREQMGLQWPIAAVAAALVVALAGLVYLATGTGAPDPPAQPLLRIAEVDPRGARVVPAGTPSPDGSPAPTADLAVVRAGGGVRVFLLPSPDVVWCEASGRLESPTGGVWSANGRLVGGEGGSLAPVGATVHDGVLYVDETAVGPPPSPDPRGDEPTCR
jgi:hypothetical protein